MSLKTTIEIKIKHYLLSKDEISFAYIFGSFVTEDKYNDIDIAVYLKPEFDFKNVIKYPFGYEANLLGNLSLILSTDKLDLILLNKANLLSAAQVYNSGKLLFERDKFFRIKIENSIRKEYIDTEKYRKLKEKQLKQYLNVR
jgi:predicted nucleotidyltransferase